MPGAGRRTSADGRGYDPLMSKKDRTSLEETAASFGVGKLTRHLFVCLGPDCCDRDDGEETWDYVKKRMKELNIAGEDGPCYRTKVGCLRICDKGPIALVYPEGTWYHGLTPDRIPLFVERHLIQGEPVKEWVFAENELPKDDV